VWSIGGTIVTGETEVLGEKSALVPFVLHKFPMDWPYIEPGPPWSEGGDLPPQP